MRCNTSVGALLTHFLLVVTLCVGSGALWSYKNTVTQGVPSYFNWHPQLMLIATLSMAEAALSYRLTPGSHGVQKAVHSVVHLCALTQMGVALGFIFKFHSVNNIPDLYSAHACVGLATACVVGLQFFGGLFSFYFPGLPQPMRAVVVVWHRWLGGMALIGMFVSAMLGVLDRQRILWGQNGSNFGEENRMFNALAVLLAVSLASVLYHLSAGATSVQRKYKNEDDLHAPLAHNPAYDSA